MKTLKKFLFVIIICFLFTACFSRFDYFEAGKTSLGVTLSGVNAGMGRATGNPDELRYELTFTGPGGQIVTATGFYGDTVYVQVVPGRWSVNITAIDPLDSDKTVAIGVTRDIEVRAGQRNSTSVQMAFAIVEPIQSYLEWAGNPVSLHLALQLTQDNWNDLLDALASVNKNVNMNLALCTRSNETSGGGLLSNGTFNPSTGSSAGKGYVVSLTLPDAATNIADGNLTTSTFDGFSSLEYVNTGSGVTSIGDYAFSNVGLSSFTITNNITSIGDNAFSGNNLSNVNIPNSVSSIGADAFTGNPLVSINIGAGKSFNTNAFPNGFMDVYSNIFNHPAGNFSWNGSIWNLVFSQPLRNIIDITSFLYGHSGGTTVDSAIELAVEIQLTDANWNTLLRVIDNIGKYVELDLSACTRSGSNTGGGLRSNGVFDPINYIFIGMYYIVSLTLPEAAISIESYSFLNSNSLRHFNTGNGLEIIGDYAFISNDGINHLQLTTIILGRNVTTIGRSAFHGSLLTNITIPNSVTSIGADAFANNQLLNANISNNILHIENRVFVSNLLTSISIPDSVITIGSSAFQQNQLNSVIIPDSVITVGSAAFKENNLASISIGNRVATIGLDAFSVNQLTSVTIPSSVTSIGPRAFAWNQLTSIAIPNSVTFIGYEAFIYNQLNNIIISNSVNTIESNAFGQNPITSVTIGADVTLNNTYPFDEYVPCFPGNFDDVYISGGRRAGTYTRPNTTAGWVYAGP